MTITHDVDADASYSAANGGFDFPPPQLSIDALVPPTQALPFAAYLFASKLERFSDGRDLSGNGRDITQWTGARPSPNYWQTSPADACVLPFSAAQLLALNGAFTMFMLANVPPATVQDIISSYANNPAQPSVGVRALATNGSNANWSQFHTETQDHENQFYDANRGAWCIHTFEFNANTLPGSSQSGKMGALIIPPGASPSSAVEHDYYPGETLTGGAMQLSVGASLWGDTAITPVGGAQIHSMLFYQGGLTPYLEAYAAAALVKMQAYSRQTAGTCGIVI